MNPGLVVAALALAVVVVPGALAAPDLLDVPESSYVEPVGDAPTSQEMVLWSQTLRGIMPHSDDPFTHKLVLGCTGDALLYSMNLYVPGDGYSIRSDSIRLDGVPLDHGGYRQEGGIRTNIMLNPVGLGADAFPLVLSRTGSLMIPVEVAGGSAGATAVADITYVSGSQATCSLGTFDSARVGALFPLDIGFGGFGNIMLESTRMGAADFNAYLGEAGEDWTLELDIRNTISEDVTAAADELASEGVRAHLGPPDASNLAALAAHDPGAAAISCCGTSSFLEEADGVFRTAPSDRYLATEMARLMWHNGIRILVPVWTDDVWNNGYRDDIAEAFAGLGGTVDDGIMQEAGSRLGELGAQIRDRVISLADAHGSETVAVFSLPTDDMAFLEAMSSQDGAETVRWFGTDYTARDARYLENPSISEFASETGYTALQVEGAGADLDATRQALAEATGRVATHDMLAAYESAWIMGLAIQQTQSTDPDRLREAIPHVALRYQGTLGQMMLDPNGDLLAPAVEVWSVHDGEWVLAGVMR